MNTYSADLLCDKGSFNVQSGCGSTCLTSSVTSADDNNIEIIFSSTFSNIYVNVVMLRVIER